MGRMGKGNKRKEIEKMNTGIILVSGGMDSCVTAASAINDGFSPAFLHINYGQRTESRELMASNEIAHYYQVDQKLLADDP